MSYLYVRQQKRHRCKTDFWTLWEKPRVGWFDRIALKHVNYHMWNRWPVQVQCMKQGTHTGALREPKGKGWGDTCTPMADSCQYMAKPSTILYSY